MNLYLLTQYGALADRFYQCGGNEHLPTHGEALDAGRQIDRLPDKRVLRAPRGADTTPTTISPVRE